MEIIDYFLKLSPGFIDLGIFEDLAAETDPPPLVGLFAVTDVHDGFNNLLLGLETQPLSKLPPFCPIVTLDLPFAISTS